MSIQPSQFLTSSLRQSTRGEDICRILAAAVRSVEPSTAIKNHVHLDRNWLVIDQKSYDLTRYSHVYILAVGKGSIPMAASVSEILAYYLTSGMVITKKGYLSHKNRPRDPRLSILEANHPLPGASNLEASAKLTSTFARLNKKDLVICLLSGGGSALLVNPSPGISIADVQVATQLLLACGAEIGEINIIRKHIDEFKGGKLARFLYPAEVITLILSDVMGDAIDQIASGPTTADPTTFIDALSIIHKYQLIDTIPAPILAHLQAGIDGRISETVKAGNPAVEQIQHVILANNAQAMSAAEQAATEIGYSTRLIETRLQGEASIAGRILAESAKSLFKSSMDMTRAACLITGGETTVHVRGSGSGGRNQELALGAVKYLAGNFPLILVSLATDGDDGPTDAAGAVVTNLTCQRGLSKGLDPDEYLANNDAYHYFDYLGDLIKTGPTLTNVNDLVFIFAT